jgi:lipoyl(octanoyl) transferase
MKLNIIRLGKIEYGQGMDLQLRLMKMRQNNLIEDTIILLQHPHVLTMGVSGSKETEENLLVSEAVLEKKGVSLYKSTRGGKITYHGPGQIVGYPIIDLNNHGKDIRQYVNNLEEFFIRMMEEEFGIDAGRDEEHRGVWVENDKITAIGCSVKKWVTMHGFAFNVNTDMNYFKLINPCGILGKGVVSLRELTGTLQDEKLVESLIVEYFADLFGYDEIVEYGDNYKILLEVAESA